MPVSSGRGAAYLSEVLQLDKYWSICDERSYHTANRPRNEFSVGGILRTLLLLVWLWRVQSTWIDRSVSASVVCYRPRPWCPWPRVEGGGKEDA